MRPRRAGFCCQRQQARDRSGTRSFFTRAAPLCRSPASAPPQSDERFSWNDCRYFARPSPSLVGGTAILARVGAEVAAEWGSHATDAEADAALGALAPLVVPGLIGALEGTGLVPAEGVGWVRVSEPSTNELGR